ncbi:MAG: hypothetical protein AAB400_03965 [Patescibacteria group bacterium]
MVFQIISTLIQSVEGSVGLANMAALAYHVGTGNDPATYQEFGVDKPIDVAMNLAGSYAVQTAASLIANQRNGEVTEYGYEKAIHDLASDNLTDSEKRIARQCANLAWKVGQPFRSLDRVTRAPMVDFNLLPEEEKIKDDDQIRAAAQEFVRHIGRPAMIDN